MIRKKELLLDEALRLPEVERADLAAKLIESPDGERDTDVDAAWAENSAIGSIVHRVRIQGTARRLPVRRFPYFVVCRGNLPKPPICEIVC